MPFFAHRRRPSLGQPLLDQGDDQQEDIIPPEPEDLPPSTPTKEFVHVDGLQQREWEAFFGDRGRPRVQLPMVTYGLGSEDRWSSGAGEAAAAPSSEAFREVLASPPCADA